MRKILFRGKRIDNGELVYGYFADMGNKACIIKSYESYWDEDCKMLRCRPSDIIPVDFSTAGQFTGLTDKNGKKIFEGDIISVEFELDREPELGEPTKWYENFSVVFDEEHHCWGTKISKDEAGEWLYEYDDDCATVVGNIYDNPELLKSKVD